MPPRESFVAKRAAKLAAHQAALPEAERLVNRTDWDKHVDKTISVLVRQARTNSKNAFIDLATDPNVGICSTVDEANAYFQPGGKPFTGKILRMFMEAYAISRSGTIEDIPSICTARGLILNLFGAAKAVGNSVERDIKTSTMMWLEHELPKRGLVHKNAREKPTPVPQDITTFLKYLFHRDFMSTLHTTRDVLLIALYVCLSIDCASRISELLRPNMSKENLAEYKIEQSKKAFLWDSVELFAFKNHETGSISLQARLTFKNIKDAVKKSYKKKVIPLRLLPPKLVAEDSLFWLINLGLIDSVFVGITTWSDFERLNPGPYGLLIPIKHEMHQRPVSFGRRPIVDQLLMCDRKTGVPDRQSPLFLSRCSDQ